MMKPSPKCHFLYSMMPSPYETGISDEENESIHGNRRKTDHGEHVGESIYPAREIRVYLQSPSDHGRWVRNGKEKSKEINLDNVERISPISPSRYR